MKTKPGTPRRVDRGYTILIVLIFTGIALLLLGSALNWCSTNAAMTERNNQYFNTLAATEAATEKVLSKLAADFQAQGESLVSANMNTYRTLVPTAAESAAWANFQFNDGQYNPSRTYVQRLAAVSYVALQSQYKGIYGLASSYRVISNARMAPAQYVIDAALQQDFQLASIPLFQFAIFYTPDLEINPGPNMTVTGRVHGNAAIYMQPVSTLEFESHVTAVGKIFSTKDPLDPLVRSLGNSHVIFDAEHDANVSSINLPIGTNNTATAVRAILEVPPGSEPINSVMGQERYLNKADLVIMVSNTTVTARSGSFNNFATTIPWSEADYFINTNASFFNKRELKTVQATQLDVAKLKTWSQTNSSLRSALGGLDVQSIYIADERTQTASTESGVRVVNGQTLPNLGLTVATPNPLYVQGNFNAPTADLGTTNTSRTLPASLVGDSIDILSTVWNDANSGRPIGNRIAANTTVNAAMLGGIVPSDGTSYSGGVENFPRFLEDWSGKTLAYNGSMVVMFYSKIATAPWGSGDVYSPPIRQWTFDLNFMDPAKLPPCTPEARALIRGQWASIKPNTVF